jgi:predicted NBD/HSP70 family sugar kinase
MKNNYLFFDIGATKTRLAVSTNLNSFETPLIFKTPKKYDQAVNLFVKSAKEMVNNEKLTIAVGGLPGYCDPRGKLHIWRNLSNWKGKFIKKDLVNAFRSPVHIQNDAALVGLGEAVCGAGKNFNIVAYITLSTGINGIRIVNKKIDVSARGFEIGHQIIDFDKSYGQGNFERMVSGADLALKFSQDPSKISASTWNEVAKIVAIGLNNTILHWSPEVVVLGGGLTKSLKISEINKHLKKVLNIYDNLPPLKKSKLGDIGGLYGALHYTRELKKTIKF